MLQSSYNLLVMLMIVLHFVILNKWKRIVHGYGSTSLANLIIYSCVIYTYNYILPSSQLYTYILVFSRKEKLITLGVL